MENKYLLLFHSVTGVLLFHSPVGKITEEQEQEYISKGYDVVSKETYDLVTGVTDGKERRKSEEGDGYIVVEVSLERAKNKKINEFKNRRDCEEVLPIEVNNHLFDYDSKARERISAAIIALEGQDPIYWTTADNDNVLVSANDLKEVVRAVAIRSNILHVKYRQLKEQVLNAATNEAVQAVTWEE